MEVKSDEGFKLLIKVLMADLEEFNENLAAEERNSSAEVCNDDRSLFSIEFVCDFQSTIRSCSCTVGFSSRILVVIGVG